MKICKKLQQYQMWIQNECEEKKIAKAIKATIKTTTVYFTGKYLGLLVKVYWNDSCNGIKLKR
jgi:hypothetical protein